MKKLTKKERIKVIKRRRKVLGILSIMFLILGLLSAFSTAGASDLELIEFHVMIIRIIMSLILLIISYIGMYVLEVTR